MAGGRRATYPGNWRADLVALALLVGYGAIIRAPLYGGLWHGAMVSGLLEPFACLIAVGLRLLFRTLRFERGLSLRAVAVVALCCMAGALAQAAVARALLMLLGLSAQGWSLGQSWALPFSYYTFILLSWSLAHLWMEARVEAEAERARAMAAETDALKSELQHLRHQLDPHFLFNALNGVAAEIPAHPDAAVRMVRELSDFLRYLLAHRDLALAPLSAEVEAIRAYLEVQKARFGDDLDYRIDVAPETLIRLTPGFLLQPLVENAIKHGLKSGRRPLLVTVVVALAGERLEMRVASSGTLRPDWKLAGAPGVGLSVLLRRLALHYPGRQSFDLRQEGAAVIAAIVIEGEPCLM